MKKTIALWMLLAPAICWAQPPAECKPSSLNVPGAPYPCVFPDHRAMFRLSAPDAQKVRVRVGTGFDMAKEADGLWYATTTPLARRLPLLHGEHRRIQRVRSGDGELLWRRAVEQRD